MYMANPLFKTVAIIAVIAALVYGAGALYLSKKGSLPQVDAQIQALLQRNNSADLDGTIAAAEQHLNTNPKDEDAQLVLAAVYLDKGAETGIVGEYAQKAQTLINQVLAADPNNTEAHRQLGYSYEIEQMYGKAIAEYTIALQLDPSDDLSYEYRGHAYDLYGNLTQAKADYDSAYSLNPSRDVTLMNLARYYSEIGDATNTIAYAQQAIKVATKARIISTLYLSLSTAYDNQDVMPSAFSAVNSAISADPTYFSPYMQRAYFNLEDVSSLTASSAAPIENDIDKAISLNPGSSNAYFLKAEVAKYKNDTASSKTYVDKGLALLDADTTLTADGRSQLKAEVTSFFNLH